MKRYLLLYNTMVKLHDKKRHLKGKPILSSWRLSNMKRLCDQIQNIEIEMALMEDRFCDALPMPVVWKLIDDPQNNTITM